jgi:hypothetical protein
MKDTIDMVREAGIDAWWDSGSDWRETFNEHLKAFEALIRADEREQGQKWFDAVTAQNKQLILAEREACAKVCEDGPERQNGDGTFRIDHHSCAAAIRNRGNT